MFRPQILIGQIVEGMTMLDPFNNGAHPLVAQEKHSLEAGTSSRHQPVDQRITCRFDQSHRGIEAGQRRGTKIECDIVAGQQDHLAAIVQYFLKMLFAFEGKDLVETAS